MVTRMYLHKLGIGLPEEKTRIRKIIEDDPALSMGDNQTDYEFIYAKKVSFPLNQNDTDLNRFALFMDKIRINNVYLDYIFFRFDKLVDNKEIQKIERRVGKNLCQIFLKTIDEAEKDWLKLPYKIYEKECDKRVKEIEKLIKDNYYVRNSHHQ